MGIGLKQTWTLCGTFLNLISCGFHLGYPTILLRGLKTPESEIRLSLEAESWLVSAMAISSLPSVLMMAPILQILGRKSAHITVTVPNLIACLILYLAQDFTALVIGRLVSGLTFGSCTFIAAIIIGEYSSPKYRGVFLNAKSASFALGILMVHLAGIFFDWRTTALIGVIPSGLSLLNTFTWKESPSWLSYKGRYEDSKASFEWLRGHSDKAKKELLLLMQTQRHRRMRKIEGISRITRMKQTLSKFTRKDFQRPLLIVLCVFVILEACGRHSFSSYAVKFMSAFTADNSTVLYYVVAVDGIVFICGVCSCGIVKLFRRRTILFTSACLACGLLICICVYLYIKPQGKAPERNVWLPLLLLFVYFITISGGVIPSTLSLIGEIYPLEHRGLGTIVSGILLSLSLLIVLKVTPALISAIDVYGTFFVYAVCMAGSFLYLYFFLPETEGKTLQEIEHHFNGVSLTLHNDNEGALLYSR